MAKPHTCTVHASPQQWVVTPQKASPAAHSPTVPLPEFVSRVVRQGMEEDNVLPSITATVTQFDGMDYRSISSVPSEEDKSLKRWRTTRETNSGNSTADSLVRKNFSTVSERLPFTWMSEGAQLPQTTVQTQNNLVQLHKRGRMLVASYEAMVFIV